MSVSKVNGSSPYFFKSNLNEPWSRKKSTLMTFGSVGAIADMFVANKIANKIIDKTNTKMHYMTVNGLVGIGILGISLFAGYLFHLYDKKHPTKFVDMLQKLENGSNFDPKKKPEQVSIVG